ncbi:precorrin-3B synthase [Thioclava sp.]|uniref:precorrin-3B synthase n=1 Tax=Thioclava sp. TaxID=1933450 RepID=UPI003AA8CC1E
MSVRIHGWCPTARRPMASGDGLVVRLSPKTGRITPEQAVAIAAAAQTYGNALIDLSGRANVQLRGVDGQHHAALIADLMPLGLIEAATDGTAPSLRNIIVTPFADEATCALAESLRLALADAPELPDKFGFMLDCGQAPVMRDVSADIRLERTVDGALIMRASGLDLGALITQAHAAEAMVDFAHWFVAAGGVCKGRGRMAQLIAQGARPQGALAATHAPAPASARPKPGLVAQGALVAFEFGQLRGETLAALAALGSLRITPWRMVLVEGLRQMPELQGLITDPDDPMLRVFACTGAPGCLQGQAPVRALARTLAPRLDPEMTLHVSGCAKGCAWPARASLTLTATPQGFDLIHDGRAGDGAETRTLSTQQIFDLSEFS